MPFRSALVQDVADRLIEAATSGDRPFASSTLVFLAPSPPEAESADSFDLGFKELNGQHVAHAVLGFTAPPEWWALGAITGGWAAPLSDGDEHESARGRAAQRPSAHPDAVRVTGVYLVARDGTEASRMRFADGRVLDDPPPSGFVGDAFKRALGLPTPPPEVPVGELYTSMWLTLVVRAGDAAMATRARRLSWPAAVARHPALSDRLPARQVATPEGLATAVEWALSELDWCEIWRWAQRGSLAPFIDRELAGWMDEGMMARWVLSEMAPLHVLVDAAAARLTPAAAAKLRDCVDLLVLSAHGHAA